MFMPAQVQPEHAYSTWPVINLIIGIVTGGGGLRFLVYMSKALPPCPKNAGFFQQFMYNCIKNVSGLDPSSTIMPQHSMQAMREAAEDGTLISPSSKP
jgi:hypothetical protein